MSNLMKYLQIAKQICLALLCAVFIAASSQAQTSPAIADDNQDNAVNASAFAPQLRFSLTPAGTRTIIASRSTAFSLMPMAAGPNLQVLGGGTLGRLTKWAGFTSSNSLIVDSTIFESKSGLVGIGTDSPSSKLTVAGMIETTLGGYKFPDGTVQTTAAMTGTVGIFHDATLSGDGKTATPLGVAIPLMLQGAVGDGNGVITVTNTAAAGRAIFAVGGNANESLGGGAGLIALGGSSSTINSGGVGLVASGGSSSGASGGTGGAMTGGISTDGDGGIGAVAMGGLGVGMGNRGGRGIFALRGSGADGATDGRAGDFISDVLVSGNLSVAGTKNFKIDHPLDPANKYLYHAAIESSEVLNVYSGNARLDVNGEAIVKLPEWFEALNKEFRYTLTPVGAPGQGLYIAEEVFNNQFKIAGGLPGAKVSWQVTGIRSDATMHRHPFKAEEDKPERERGYYLNPEAFNQPEERSVEWARNPDLMRQIKETREKHMETLKQKTQSNDR